VIWRAAIIGIAAAFVALVGLGTPAHARPVIDCPLRDAPFSVQSPLIDLLLSEQARGLLVKASSGRIEKIPARFLSTTPPTFSAILTLREVAAFSGISPQQLGSLDAELRTLPVTPADRIARCARYDNTVPHFNLPRRDKRPRLLVFGKMTGFKDVPGYNAAQAALEAMARRKGWIMASTELGGAINPRTLRQFDAVIWNNNSGDVLTLSQRRALQRFVESGGGFAALHGAAGDPNYFWDWYADNLIGTRFTGHAMAPQFQEARVVVNTTHPVARTANLPAEWRMTDEWYSFRSNPREKGATVLLSLDEASYKPVGPMGIDIRMGDHPIAWTNCIGKGRMFYSAIGHKPETYAEPVHLTVLEHAIEWVANKRQTCKP
jgi:type 1 glutamine amidotransferase